MKIRNGLILLLVLCLVLPAAALADGELWECPNCGLPCFESFCGNCGTAKPDQNAGGDWTCAACGREWPDDYFFCPKDGIPRADLAGEWPVKTLTGISTLLKDGSSRRQSYAGPGSNYIGAGAYKPEKVSSGRSLFCEGSYVYVDLIYPSVGRRCLYFSKSNVQRTNVDEVTLTGTDAVMLSDETPRFGPGTEYDKFTSAALSAGDELTVFFETDGWVFAEYTCKSGLARAWFPADTVSAR